MKFVSHGLSFKEFEDILLRMHQEELKIGEEKGQEYAHGGNRLDNFNRLSVDLDLPREKVLWVYLKKHLDAVLYYVQHGKLLSDEGIDSRIRDARLYLALLQGMVDEDSMNRGKQCE